MLRLVLIMCGGALGAVSRFGVSSLVNRLFQHNFPLGTLAVNVLGSFLIGLLYQAFAGSIRLPVEFKLMILVGFLGAFTTFSSYSLETLQLLRAQAYLPALFNFLLNNTLCLLAVAGGFLLSSR